MADPLLHRLPLADPSSDSLGRLNGQYPALTDVDCADDVGVPFVAAHLTAEPIPGGTVVCMCVAASGGWTAQRRVWRRGEFNPAAAFLFLVGEERGEHTPSLVENAAVETALLGNVLARFFDGARGTRRHIPHAELFQPVHAEALGETGRLLVQEILANIGFVHTKPRYPSFQLVPVGRELDLAGEPLLQLRKLVTNAVEGVDGVDKLADGGRSEHRNASVDADWIVCRLRRVRSFLLPQDANEPLACLPAEGDRAEVAAERSVSAEANPADLGKLDGAVAFVESLELDVLRRQREGVVLELLSRCRVTAQLLEEAAERLVEVAQGVLQRMDGDEFEPILGSPAHRQFLCLRNVGERESVVAVFVLSPLKGVIVFVPARANPPGPLPAPDTAMAQPGTCWRARGASTASQEAQGQHHGGLGREQRRPRVQGWKAFPATRQIPLHQRGRAREFQGVSPRPYWRVQNPRLCDIPRNSCIRRTGGFGSSWNGESSGTCRTRPCTRL